MEFIQESLHTLEDVFVPVLSSLQTEALVAIGAVSLLVLALIVWCVLRGASKGSHVCLLGLSDSGKTLLHQRLRNGCFLRTQNSIKENVATYAVSNKKGKPVKLVDIPGDERIRDTIFNKYKDSLRAIILVVDSVNFPRESRNLAELTFDLLLEKALYRQRTPLLVACNKQELSLAQNCGSIRTRLEAEITALRVSRAAKLSALDGGGRRGRATKMASFWREGKDFEFSDLPLRVEFVACSARGKGEEEACQPDIATVREWLEKNC